MPARERRPHTQDWQQLKQYCLWPQQRAYELLRPIVLFGDLPVERAAQTGAAKRTLRRGAEQFDAHGMHSLVRPTAKQQQDAHRSLPPPMRQCIVDLKADYAGLSLHEIAAICYVRFGRRPSPNTVKQVLADGPPPTMTTRRYPPYAEVAEPAARRHIIVTLHAEGWTPTSIADYLEISRTTVYETLRRWVKEGTAGLADKSRANTRPVRKVNLATKNTIRKLQENPELGAFRIYAALRQMGIHVSQATCGRILAENRRLYGLGKPSKAAKEPKGHPYKAEYRHHIWSVDVRYIEHHQIPEITGPFYIISVLDNFSRAILSSDVFQRQDLTAYLVVLYAAIQQHGCPTLLLSDSGAIFRAKHARAIYEALGIEKQQIHKKQAWENLIETQFNLQRRLADYHFAQATS
jgi:putative transposase